MLDPMTESPPATRSFLLKSDIICDQKCSSRGREYCGHYPIFRDTEITFHAFIVAYKDKIKSFNPSLSFYDLDVITKTYKKKDLDLNVYRAMIYKIIVAFGDVQPSPFGFAANNIPKNVKECKDALQNFYNKSLIVLHKQNKECGDEFDLNEPEKFPILYNCIDYAKDIEVVKANLLLYISEATLNEMIGRKKATPQATLDLHKKYLKHILVYNLKQLMKDDYHARQDSLPSHLDRDDTILCFFHGCMRTSHTSIDHLVIFNLEVYLKESKSQVSEKDTLKKMIDKIKKSIEGDRRQQSRVFDIKKEKKSKPTWHLDGGDLRKAMSISLDLVNIVFDKEELRGDDCFGNLCYNNWVNFFGLYEEIMKLLSDRKKYWFHPDDEVDPIIFPGGKSTVPDDGKGYLYLSDKIHTLHLLYLKMFGADKVTIYFHMLFNGTYINMLRKYHNLAVFDQQTFELLWKCQKEAGRRCSNLKEIAFNQYLYYVLTFVMNIETNNDKCPCGDKFLAEFNKIRRKTDKERSNLWAEIVKEGNYDTCDDNFMFPGEDMDAQPETTDPKDAWRYDDVENEFDNDARNDYDYAA